MIQGVLASALAVVGLVAFATPAFAHNNIVTADAACNSPLGTGFKITWTVENDYDLSETGTVTSVTGGLGTLNSTTFSIGKSPQTPYTSTTLTQTLPASASGTITIDISGTWSDSYSTTDTESVSLSSLGCADPKQTIAGHIFLCNNGNPTSIEESGGMLSAGGSGLSTVSPAANPLAPTDVIAGTYTMTASTPPGYSLVTCGGSSSPDGSSSSATESVNVPSGGAGSGVFYVTPAVKGLSISKSISTVSVSSVGDPISYTFVVTDTGNVPLTGVGVTDDPVLPAGALTSGPVCISLATPSGSCTTTTSTTLVPGQAATFTASYDVTQADLDNGSVDDTSTATGHAGSNTVTATSNEVWVPVVQTPSLTIVKSTTTSSVSHAGATIPYIFVVTNTGNVTLTAVDVNDTQESPAGPLTSGPTCVSLSSPSGTCSGSAASRLAPGQSATFAATYTVTQADLDHGSVNDSATSTGHTPDNRTITSDPSTAMVGSSQVPDISVVKTASVNSVSAVGQTVTYTFAVTNTGGATLDNIEVTDAQATPPLGANLGPISCATGTNGSIMLAPGASDTCSATYTVTRADLDNGSITDTATVTGDPLNSDTPVRAHATLTLSVISLSVVKSASPSAGVVAGSTTPIVYTITVKNSGTATTSQQSVVTDAAPTGTTLVSGSPACAHGGPPACTVSVSGSTITWAIPAGVAPGASYTLTFAVEVDASDAAGTIANTASWSGPSCGAPAAVGIPTTCPTNTVDTPVTTAPVTAPAAVTPTATTTPTPAPTQPTTSASATPAIAFTGAMLSEEWMFALAALALGAGLVVLARRRRRPPPKHAGKHTAKHAAR